MVKNVVFKIPFTGIRYDIYNAVTPQHLEQSHHRRHQAQPRIFYDPTAPQAQPRTRQTQLQPQMPREAPTHSIPELSLSLSTLWYTSSSPTIPASITRSGPPIHYGGRTLARSSNGIQTNTLVLHFLFPDFSRTKVKIEWSPHNPRGTVQTKQRHYIGYSNLSRRQLGEFGERYGGAVASWCENQMGKTVGNGECWTLAHDALATIASLYKRKGIEQCFISQDVIHGVPIWRWNPTSRNVRGVPSLTHAGVGRGDIIQFKRCHFKSKMRERRAGMPDHTAVVTGNRGGGVLDVVEQNGSQGRVVGIGRYEFGDMVGGSVTIFRVVGDGGHQELDAEWEEI